MPRPRGSAIHVKPEAIRLARIEAGLSLEQLARGLVSRQAIHQYESGASSPSLAVLQAIADRTGRSLEYFLGEPPATTAELLVAIESAFLRRELEEVVNLAGQALDRDLSPDDRARVQGWLGGALMHLSRPGEAVEHLRTARTHLRGAADPWALAEVLDWEACSLHLMDSPGATALAEEALVLCRSRDPVRNQELEARILSHLGSFAVRQRDWPRALAIYREAVETAEGLLDLRALAMMRHNLSIAYQRTGQPALARREADRALALFSAQANRSDLARLLSDYGDLLVRQGETDEAERYLRQALATYVGLDDQRNRAYTLITLAQVLTAKGHLDKAAELVAEAQAVADASPEQAIVAASVERAHGRILAAQDDLDGARQHYYAAIAQFEQAANLGMAAETRAELAAHLEAAGDLQGALLQMRLANQIALGTWSPSAEEQAEKSANQAG